MTEVNTTYVEKECIVKIVALYNSFSRDIYYTTALSIQTLFDISKDKPFCVYITDIFDQLMSDYVKYHII